MSVNVKYSPLEIFKALRQFKKTETARNQLAGVGRNQKCPCGSGLKFKKCCLNAELEARRLAMENQDDAQKMIQNEFEQLLRTNKDLEEAKNKEENKE